MFHDKTKKKWLKIFIYIFISLFLFIIISWILTVSIGTRAVKKEHELFLHSVYKIQKEAYKKNPAIALFWTKPQMGVTVRRAEFWKRKLFKEKKYPSFEEWRNFHLKRNSISYHAFCPFIIESKHYAGNIAWKEEYHFWFFGYIRKYKHEVLVFLD